MTDAEPKTTEEKDQLAAAKAMLSHCFASHPATVGESYLQHMWFTVVMGLKLILGGVAIIIHGIFPLLFTRTASNVIAKLYAITHARAELADRIAREQGDKC